MFTFDERIRGLPASREQVASLFQSINTPHLAIPGKHAGPAQAFILGLRSSAGFTAFIYLSLPESADCAVYVSDQRSLSAEAFPAEENDAQSFVESMGFIMDNLNFQDLSQSDQDVLIKTLPPFRKEPKVASGSPATTKSVAPSPAASLARLLAAF